MGCKKIKKLILNYWDLTDQERECLEEHLKDCPSCAKEFDFYHNSMEMIKQSFEFEVGENFWELYESALSKKLSKVATKSLILSWVEDFFQFLKTPIIGPLPTYLFSILIVLLFLIGLYPAFNSKSFSKRFENNLVIHEGEIFSTIDDGEVTIYLLEKK